VRYHDGGTESAGEYTFSNEWGMRIMNYLSYIVNNRIISAVKRVEFVSVRELYIILRGSCCHVIVLNIHAQPRTKLMM
jgi:hypothetical protein